MIEITNKISKYDKIKFHFIFLFILSLYYLVPYFLIGQLTLYPHDTLDIAVVLNKFIGKMYHGDVESINIFLGGQIKWYFLRGVLQPITLLYALFNSEVAFWVTDITVKLISYICFFKLSRKLLCSYFNSALISCLFVSSLNYTIFGLGSAVLPYIIYIIIKNKNLSIKHYFVLILFGLNIDLANNVLLIPLVFFITYVLNLKYRHYNFKLFIKVATILGFFIFLSNSNLFYAQIFAETSQRSVWSYDSPNLTTNFYELFKNFFFISEIKDSSYFFHHLPFTLFFFPIVLVSLFSKNKTSFFLLLITFFILFIDFFLNLEFINSIRNNSDGSLRTLDWGRIRWKIPMIYCLLFINIISSQAIQKYKYIVYSLIFLLLISIQIRIAAVPVGKYYLSFESLNQQQQSQLRKNFYNQEYILLIKNVLEFNKNKHTVDNKKFKSSYTFEGYYDYKNYKYIKSIVNNSRTISIGLDPMVAAMNDIKVIDGYHTFYPLSYKLKFRKIIESQLNEYEVWRKYYDGWGERVYTFVSNPNIIKINFYKARELGAEYVISKFPISNDLLKPVCINCNNSSNFFLYKIDPV